MSDDYESDIRSAAEALHDGRYADAAEFAAEASAAAGRGEYDAQTAVRMMRAQYIRGEAERAKPDMRPIMQAIQRAAALAEDPVKWPGAIDAYNEARSLVSQRVTGPQSAQLHALIRARVEPLEERYRQMRMDAARRAYKSL